MEKFLNSRFSLVIYFLCLFIETVILYQGCAAGLFGLPQEGMDQRTFLEAAVTICQGHLPEKLDLSYLYTLWVSFLAFISCGRLFFMRFLQAVLCAFIPVLIYKLCIRLRMGVKFSQIAALIHCFYGPAMLIVLDFLREAPLALMFLLAVYVFVRAWGTGRIKFFFLAGLCAGACLLGRENFFPIILIPFLFFFHPAFRKHCPLKNFFPYISGIIIIVVPFLILNILKYDSYQIIPGHIKNIAECYHGAAAYSDPALAVSSVIKKIPGEALKFISSYEIPNSLSFYAHREVIGVMSIFVIPFNLLVGLALCSVFLCRKNPRILLVFAAAFAYFATMIYFEMFYRFRIPVEPLICVLAAAGIKGIYELHRIKWRILVLLLLGGFFVLTWKDSWKLRTESEKISVIKVLSLNGRFDEAERLLARLNPESEQVKLLKERLAGQKADFIRKETESRQR